MLQKRIKYGLVMETVFVFLLAIFLHYQQFSGQFGEILWIFQILIILYLIFALLIPSRKFEENMKELLAEDNPDMKAHEMLERDNYMGQIVELIDKCILQRTRENAAQIFDKQTELIALQSQINPHFLYNTLECIRGQALLDDNYGIANMTEVLSSFFRYSISRKGNLVTLRDELDNTSNYMQIQRYRFNNRFSLEIRIDEEDKVAYDYLIPRLILQPVVENAIFHGLRDKLEDGKIIIEIIVTDSNLMIIVSDNGEGIESEQLKELNNRIHSQDLQMETKDSTQSHTGIALPNVNKRIRLLFGDQYGINVYSVLGHGTDVEIIVPADYMRKEGWEDEEGIIEGS